MVNKSLPRLSPFVKQALLLCLRPSLTSDDLDLYSNFVDLQQINEQFELRWYHDEPGANGSPTWLAAVAHRR